MPAQPLTRTEYPDQFITRPFNIVAPAQVNQLMVADGVWEVDSFRIAFGTKSSVTGATCWLQKGSDAVIRAAAVAISSATWNNTAKTLAKTGSFVGYTWREGDIINVTGGTGWTTGFYRVASKTDNDTIVLTNLDGTAISVTGSSDVAATFNPGVPLTGMGSITNPNASSAAAGVAIDGTANTVLDGTILFGDVAATVPTPRNRLADKEALLLICSGTPTALANLTVSVRMRSRIR